MSEAVSVHFTNKSDEWATPQTVFDALNEEFRFSLDVAASSQNAKCAAYYDAATDGLSQEWRGVLWCNPPYSQVAKWIAKAHESAQNGATVVMLIPARTDTKAWHEYIFPFAEVRFLKGRLKFGDSKNSAPFPSAVVIFRSKNEQI